MKRIIQLVLIVPTVLCAATIQVPSDEPTIQAGIDAAAVHDTVLVAKGIYTGDDNRDVDFGGKSVVLKSEDGADSTVIDCEGSVGNDHRAIVIGSGEDSTCAVDGFTVRGGYAGAGGAVFVGGGSSPTIRNCVFRSNVALCYGGSVYCQYSYAKFEQCSFDSNAQSEIGYECDCSDWGSGGGAVYSEESNITLVDCEFTSNRAYCGEGAVKARDGSVVMDGCTVSDNDGGGWGLFSMGMGAVSLFCAATVSNSVFFGNHGYATGFVGRVSFSNSTFANNDKGVFCSAGYYNYMDHCIIAHNADQGVHPDINFGCVLELTCCNIYGNVGGDWVECIADQLGTNGNISADPRFCDAANGDYSIDSLSPCAPSYNVCGQLIGALEPKCTNYEPICGDVDASGETDIDDIVYLINFVFAGGPSPIPLKAGNVDCSGIPDIDDIVYLINFVFASGPAPCDPDGNTIPNC